MTVVWEQGKIIETGTHDELMKFGQQYYEMFSSQASYYGETSPVV
ncbi:MAG: hypothetical protein SWJ54_10430 [Cyanobacteriota bacterium]|nr:hypothetical protein [Cyanobacteriota bacterium]